MIFAFSYWGASSFLVSSFLLTAFETFWFAFTGMLPFFKGATTGPVFFATGGY